MMETQDDTTTVGPLFHPLTGWEAASRWNAAAMDWWQHGFRQWIELMTASLASPAQAESGKARPARTSRNTQDSRHRVNEAGLERAVAKGEPKRTKRAARAKAAAGKSRARG